MAGMSDVKVLSKITGRKVDPDKMEDIKRAIFLPDLPDMGDAVSLMREYNDGNKCTYMAGSQAYVSEGPECKALLKLEESQKSVKRMFDSKIIDQRMECARRAVDKKKNSKKQGKGCDHRARSTYGNVYIVGNNDEVCAPFKAIGKLILDKDKRLFRSRRMHKQIVEKHLKKSKPGHLKKGKIRLPFNGGEFKAPAWAKDSERSAKGKGRSAK
jgi:hypothetical protein